MADTVARSTHSSDTIELPRADYNNEDLQYQTVDELRRQKQHVSQEMALLLWHSPKPVNLEQTNSFITEANQLRKRLDAIDKVMDERQIGIGPKGMEDYLARRLTKANDNVRYFAEDKFFSGILDAFDQRFEGLEGTHALKSGNLEPEGATPGWSGIKTRALIVGAGLTVAFVALAGWFWTRFKKRKPVTTSPSRQH